MEPRLKPQGHRRDRIREDYLRMVDRHGLTRSAHETQPAHTCALACLVPGSELSSRHDPDQAGYVPRKYTGTFFQTLARDGREQGSVLSGAGPARQKHSKARRDSARPLHLGVSPVGPSPARSAQTCAATYRILPTRRSALVPFSACPFPAPLSPAGQRCAPRLQPNLAHPRPCRRGPRQDIWGAEQQLHDPAYTPSLLSVLSAGSVEDRPVVG